MNLERGRLFGVENAELAKRMVDAGLAERSSGNADTTILDASASWVRADPEVARSRNWVRDGKT